MRAIFAMIVDNAPRRNNFLEGLWTKAAVQALAYREFGIHLSEGAATRLLEKLGLHPLRMREKSRTPKPKVVVDWLTSELPEIRRMARKAGASLFFGKRACCQMWCSSAVARDGNSRDVTATDAATSRKVTLMAAFDPKGGSRFLATGENFNAEVFCLFLSRLLAEAKAPVFLVVDEHVVSRSKKVCTFVGSTNGKLRLFYRNQRG